MDDFTSSEKQTYLNNDGRVCPVCDSKDLEFQGPLSSELSYHFQDVRCKSCTAEWTDKLTLIDVSARKKPYPFEEDIFIIPDVVGPVKGYDLGETWNGAACPAFEFETAQRIAAKMGGGWDEEKHAFRTPSGYDEEPWDYWFNVEMFPLYPIGAFAWMWERVEFMDRIPEEIIWGECRE